MRFYLVHAFADEPFAGNPAGVCLADAFPSDALMQRIAAENRVSETAFVVPADSDYLIRWFTPEKEIDLCGHATLAAASVLLHGDGAVTFRSASGPLSAARRGGLITLDFPLRPGRPVQTPPGLPEILGTPVVSCYRSRDLIAVLQDEAAVRDLSPDFSRLSGLSDYFGICVTARGTDCDFVSRYFAPDAGVPEDPVTGSSHCTLAPLWSAILQKKTFTAKQLSPRGGTLRVKIEGDRVKIGGKAALYFAGELFL